MAGETRVILGMSDQHDARGRLQFLSLIGHWMCACRDWTTVRALYEGVVDSIELGETTWRSDFTHYESQLFKFRVEKDKDKEVKKPEKSDKPDIYWCKPYQKGTCTEKSPHMMTIKQGESPVPVIHICAHCYQKENRRMEHGESECPKK